VFILSFPVHLGPSDTLVKHNVLLEYDAYGYGYGMGSMLVVSVTHTRLRVSGSYPSSVCLAKLTSRAAHAFPGKVLERWFGEPDLWTFGLARSPDQTYHPTLYVHGHKPI
jgi:hypothetical protein